MIDLTSKYTSKKWFADSGEPMNPNQAFLKNEIGNYDIFILAGGIRAGKTVSTLKFIAESISRYSGLKYSIVRHSVPSLRGSVIPDFIDIVKDYDNFGKFDYDVGRRIYKRNGNMVFFVSTECKHELSLYRHDVLFMSNANELDFDDVKTLLFFTRGKVILDYDPHHTDRNNWVYKEIKKGAKVAIIKTEYKDNPFITQSQIDHLEWMKLNDPDGYLDIPNM
jgi:phage terminase large subunit